MAHMANKGPGSDEDFTYTHNGETLTVRSLSKLPLGVMRRSRKLGEVEMSMAVIEALADDAALEVIDTMLPADVEAFMEAWREHSGVTEGESSAS